jgi:septation ring formation regulator EzrA
MMKSVKEQKVNQMKAIKRLTNEKTTLSKKFKDTKDINGSLKKELDESMKKYQVLQQEYDVIGPTAEAGGAAQAKAEKIASKMADLLTKIEADRQEWMQQRDLIKQLKERLKDIEQEMTDERAELVATAGLLDQNDKLRAQIQAEER